MSKITQAISTLMSDWWMITRKFELLMQKSFPLSQSSPISANQVDNQFNLLSWWEPNFDTYSLKSKSLSGPDVKIYEPIRFFLIIKTYFSSCQLPLQSYMGAGSRR